MCVSYELDWQIKICVTRVYQVGFYYLPLRSFLFCNAFSLSVAADRCTLHFSLFNNKLNNSHFLFFHSYIFLNISSFTLCNGHIHSNAKYAYSQHRSHTTFNIQFASLILSFPFVSYYFFTHNFASFVFHIIEDRSICPAHTVYCLHSRY